MLDPHSDGAARGAGRLVTASPDGAGSKWGVGRTGRVQIPQRFGLAATAVGLLVAGIAAWGFSQSIARDREARAAFPMVSGQLRVDGLGERIEIARDGRGIPHVLAASERDAWFGLGFAHAQDRLAQMVWLRRLAEGRAAEWVGEAGRDADRLARTIGFARLAAERALQIDDDVRMVLEAYVAGINARIARIQTGRVAPPVALARHLAPLVPEPTEGQARPAPTEPFTVVDCLAIGKLVAWSAGASHERAVVLSDLIERLGSIAARPFFPERDDPRGFASALAMSGELDLAPRAEARPGDLPGPPLLDAAGFRATAWALPGKFTSSGAPILVAELSVSTSVPSLLYEAHVRGGELEVAGVTIPGLPVFWAGRNADLVWAAAPVPIAAVDLFKETLRTKRPVQSEGSEETGEGRAGSGTQAVEVGDDPDAAITLYQNGSRWVPTSERIETIQLGRQPGEAFELLGVRGTAHGPLLDAIIDPIRLGPSQDFSVERSQEPSESLSPRASEREPLALSWTGARGGDAITGLLRVAHAHDGTELLSALAAHHEPPIEMAYALRDGGLGLRVAGWLPRRSIPSGLVPVPGRLRSFDWRARIDPDALPQVTLVARLESTDGDDAAAGPRGGPETSAATGSATDPATIPTTVPTTVPTTGDADAPAVPMVVTGRRMNETLAGVSLEWLWRDIERPVRVARRVEDLVREGKVELRDAVAVQNDVAANVDPAFLAAIFTLAGEPPLLSPEAQEVTDLLRRWDGQADVASRGTPAFELLLSHLMPALLEKPLGPELLGRYLALPGVRPEAVVRGVLIAAARGETEGTWAAPERVAASVRESLRRTWMSLSYRLGHNRERWTWGRLHQLTFRPFDLVAQPGEDAAGWLARAQHLFADQRGPATALDGSLLGPFGLAGRRESVARAEPDRVTFQTRRASTYRLAVDLASTNRMLTALAPGQSEHPGHPHYADGVSGWQAGNAALLVTSAFLLQEAAVERLILEPLR